MQTIDKTWYDQMIRKLQINGKSERTQEAHARAVRQLIEHYKKDPALISENELEEYFLYRRNESKWASKTLMALLLRDQVLLPVCAQHRLESLLD